MPVIVVREERPEGGHLARVTIDNQARLNTLNRPLIVEIVETIERLEADAALRLVVLTGAGERAFVGGADINELAALNRDSARDFITMVHRCCDGFRRLAAPVIARVDGWALPPTCMCRISPWTCTYGRPWKSLPPFHFSPWPSTDLARTPSAVRPRLG